MVPIHAALPQPTPGLRRCAVVVDLQSLRKRRWRGAAEDGREFGFDLQRPLMDGDTVFEADGLAYVITQKAEPVLSVPLAACGLGSAEDFVRIGWLVGNLHFPIGVEEGVLHMPDDPALRQLLEREGLPFQTGERVFRPLYRAHSHGA